MGEEEKKSKKIFMLRASENTSQARDGQISIGPDLPFRAIERNGITQRRGITGYLNHCQCRGDYLHAKKLHDVLQVRGVMVNALLPDNIYDASEEPGVNIQNIPIDASSLANAKSKVKIIVSATTPALEAKEQVVSVVYSMY
ncbi:hypothetical protein A0H81_07132 [Grifola frondosa]|uniref:Uncharacterized protein n=1 Tax=Grifola frondosa TaxID=5627 RepID=A0A1C7MAJ1_GRIFR|nr:hypothetical protein A0H81_07132 [Grifola frondosa]